MKKVESYRDLLVWQKSMELVGAIYELIGKLPKEERFALTDQMRRSAISIPSNIAEGYERNSTKDYLRFLSIAKGSKAELSTQLDICKMLGYAGDIESAQALCTEIGKMLNSIIKKLTTNP